MKKIILMSIIFATLPAFAFELPTVPLNETSPINEMQTMEAARFRHEEINYERKKANQKKTKEETSTALKEQVQQAIQRTSVPNSQTEFIRENGQLKIKYGN